MRRAAAACLLAALLLAFAAGAAGEAAPELELVLKTETLFTNVRLHYVYFDALVSGAEKLSVRVISPAGEETPFRTRFRAERKMSAVPCAEYSLEPGQEVFEDANVLFTSKSELGTWVIRVTASAGDRETTAEIPVEIRPAVIESLNQLAEARALVDGIGRKEPIPATEGRVRYIAQTKTDRDYVREYWMNPDCDLRELSGTMCTRAVYSMALGWLGVDCTPVDMSVLVKSRSIHFTYDQVSDALGNVTRVDEDLETMWAEYEAGRASPLMLHYVYNGGEHAVLLVARDRENPMLFYAVTTAQRVNTSEWPNGMKDDVILPVIIDPSRDGDQVLSPLIRRYDRGKIDRLWQWKLTEDGTEGE